MSQRDMGAGTMWCFFLRLLLFYVYGYSLKCALVLSLDMSVV